MAPTSSAVLWAKPQFSSSEQMESPQQEPSQSAAQLQAFSAVHRFHLPTGETLGLGNENSFETRQPDSRRFNLTDTLLCRLIITPWGVIGLTAISITRTTVVGRLSTNRRPCPCTTVRIVLADIDSTDRIATRVLFGVQQEQADPQSMEQVAQFSPTWQIPAANTGTDACQTVGTVVTLMSWGRKNSFRPHCIDRLITSQT